MDDEQARLPFVKGFPTLQSAWNGSVEMIPVLSDVLPLSPQEIDELSVDEFKQALFHRVALELNDSMETTLIVFSNQPEGVSVTRTNYDVLMLNNQAAAAHERWSVTLAFNFEYMSDQEVDEIIAALHDEGWSMEY